MEVNKNNTNVNFKDAQNNVSTQADEINNKENSLKFMGRTILNYGTYLEYVQYIPKLPDSIYPPVLAASDACGSLKSTIDLHDSLQKTSEQYEFGTVQKTVTVLSGMISIASKGIKLATYVTPTSEAVTCIGTSAALLSTAGQAMLAAKCVLFAAKYKNEIMNLIS